MNQLKVTENLFFPGGACPGGAALRPADAAHHEAAFLPLRLPNGGDGGSNGRDDGPVVLFGFRLGLDGRGGGGFGAGEASALGAFFRPVITVMA